jgi:8-oxo-dGTP pyrophosphatase MutT (NUDIX family)
MIVLTFAAMENKVILFALLERYHLAFGEEHGSTKALMEFLHITPANALYNRNNYVGHITASAFIVDPAQRAILLLQHRKLNRWLQPGGHVDESDQSLAEAAWREAFEETGLGRDEMQLQDLHGTSGLYDIDSHNIPANATKNEPAHVHHDLRFLFTCHQPGLLNINATEANGFKWVPLTTFISDSTFVVVAQKIERSMELF